MSRQDPSGARAPWSRSGSGTPHDPPGPGGPGSRPEADDARDRPGPRTPRDLQRDVVAAEQREFGGMKFGSAFFGWLAATGMAALLTAVLAVLGAQAWLTRSAPGAGQDPQLLGVLGLVLLALVLFASYFCGGYVAGRMARFSGAKQGVAVWLWGILVAVVLAVVAVVAGDRFDVADDARGVLRLPVGEGEATTGGVVTLVAGLLITLVGAVLGGLAGMRFHRRVDRAGIEHRTGPAG